MSGDPGARDDRAAERETSPVGLQRLVENVAIEGRDRLLQISTAVEPDLRPLGPPDWLAGVDLDERARHRRPRDHEMQDRLVAHGGKRAVGEAGPAVPGSDQRSRHCPGKQDRGGAEPEQPGQPERFPSRRWRPQSGCNGVGEGEQLRVVGEHFDELRIAERRTRDRGHGVSPSFSNSRRSC